MIGAIPARPVEPGLLPLLREAAVPMVLFSGVAHLGVAVVLGLMVLGAIPGGVGGALLLIWSVFSLLLSVLGYRGMEERRRRRAVSALAVSEMQALASRVIALYPRPVDDPVIAEVFELYRRAQASLEEGNYPAAGETIERGVVLADAVLAGDGATLRRENDEERGDSVWN